jgi:RimJ/RimL family protein N-acetyltransferase
VEISFVIHEEFQGKGMGTYLCQKLFDYAKEKRIHEITAFCLVSNKGMRAILEKLRVNVGDTSTKIEGDMIHYTFRL